MEGASHRGNSSIFSAPDRDRNRQFANQSVELSWADSAQIIGGAEGDRTPDLMTASHALSQLSYGPYYCRPR